MLSKLTLIGIHNFTKGAIWDDIMLPDGMDKKILINEILKQNGEFCSIYSNPDFLHVQIQQFFKKWYHNFERWVKAYNFEYEALYNLDVKTTRTEEGQNYENGSKTSNDSRTTSGNTSGSTSGNTSGSSSGTSENIHQKAAYDSVTFQNTEKDTGSSRLESSGTSSESTSNSSSETTSGNGTEVTSGNSNHTITIEEHRRGNQGITQSQELLLAEMNAWRFNIYSQIADVFASEFCITVYF